MIKSVVLLLLALGWFVSYAFANNWIGPLGRITLGILFGLAVVGMGMGGETRGELCARQVAARVQRNDLRLLPEELYERIRRYVPEREAQKRIFGDYKKYYPNGSWQLKIHEPYDQDGKLHGKFVMYHSNGQLAYCLSHEHGTAEGDLVKYDREGNVTTLTNFRNGRLQGEYRRYHKDAPGMLWEHYHYQNDKLHGEFKRYNQYGQLIVHKQFDNNTQIATHVLRL